MSTQDNRDEITTLLQTWRDGDETALAELMPRVYRELKKIASHQVRAHRGHDTVETTALVHETYLRLPQVRQISWADSAHFYAMCARLMRRLLVEHARHHGRAKRGSGMPKVIFDEHLHSPGEEPPEVLAVDEGLRQLAEHDPEKARIVELRYFGGLTVDEITEVLDISSATVKRRLRSARDWLKDYLTKEER